jgi:hypothetical protein
MEQKDPLDLRFAIFLQYLPSCQKHKCKENIRTIVSLRFEHTTENLTPCHLVGVNCEYHTGHFKLYVNLLCLILWLTSESNNSKADE